MSTHRLLIRGLMPLLLLFGCLLQPLSAQQDPRALDPADLFFQAWLIIRDAEKLEEEKKHSDAWQKYRQAAKYYNILSRYHKNWKPHLVQSRVESTAKSINDIEPKAAAEIAGRKAKTRDLVEGGPSSGQGSASGNERQSSLPLTQEQRQLQKYERDSMRLRGQLTRVRSQGNARNRNLEQRLIQQINDKEQAIRSLRNNLARAPLQRDVKQLDRKNRTIKAELAITARALKESQRRLKASEKLSRERQDELDLALREKAKLVTNMQQQQGVNNRVIRELRKELKNVSTLLENTRRELGESKAESARLHRSLTQAQATIQELTKERDDLRTERDTIRSILEKSDSAGVQKLIAENMRLGKELKEALDRVGFLERTNNTTKDELIEAKRDLAVAKTRIMQYQQQQSGYGRRIKALESQLHDAEAQLAKGGGNPAQNANAEEVEILRTTVKRLIASQERRRTAEKILWETYKKSKNTIVGMTEAFNDIRKAKVELTPQEKKLITYRRPDGEFTTRPERVSPDHARIHANALETEIATYTPLMKRAFEKGRFEAARQILEDMDERFPGHFPTLCNRGIVELKTNNYPAAAEIFNEAITMRENSSYAHHMLGLALYQNSDFDGSRNAFQRALDIKPNAGAHFYLGNLAGVGRRYTQAKEHFQNAIKLDPTMAEAYFNLSILAWQQKLIKEATEYYRQALEQGAQPDPKHEQKLGM